jgi:DNA-binding transcriptional ArsR family regulator
MSEIFHELANLDKLIHEPARLAILTALMACERADFLFLQRLTGLTAGNLSVHLSKLEEAGLLKSEKRFIDRRPNTVVELTKTGRLAISAYWEKFQAVSNSLNEMKSS